MLLLHVQNSKMEKYTVYSISYLELFPICIIIMALVSWFTIDQPSFYYQTIKMENI